MTENKTPIEILVFKTSLQPNDREKVAVILSNQNILDWTIDFEDIDKILRIESFSTSSESIIKLMKNSGYACEELI